MISITVVVGPSSFVANATSHIMSLSAFVIIIVMLLWIIA